MTTSRTTSHTRRTRRGPIVIVLAVAAALCVAAPTTAVSRITKTSNGGSYSWPIKPFDRPHPVRGNFGDPRTAFAGAPTQRTLLHGHGSFHFHEGVDISAAAGTPVYAVKGGTMRRRGRETVVVDSGDGVVFQYWHIVPTVADGQHVEAHELVGRVRPGEYEHVHLTELKDGKPQNPLAPGHIRPYRDSTVPQLDAASYTSVASGETLLPEFVHGRIRLVAAAHDKPAQQPVPGRWAGLPVAPARITWHVERAKDARVIVPEREAFDVRETLPANRNLWSEYARGTRQNTATFGGRKLWRQPGAYLFRLGVLDTRRMKDDVYVLVVTGSDTRGNDGTGKFTFTVHNKPGYFR